MGTIPVCILGLPYAYRGFTLPRWLQKSKTANLDTKLAMNFKLLFHVLLDGMSVSTHLEGLPGGLFFHRTPTTKKILKYKTPSFTLDRAM